MNKEYKSKVIYLGDNEIYNYYKKLNSEVDFNEIINIETNLDELDDCNVLLIDNMVTTISIYLSLGFSVRDCIEKTKKQFVKIESFLSKNAINFRYLKIEEIVEFERTNTVERKMFLELASVLFFHNEDLNELNKKIVLLLEKATNRKDLIDEDSKRSFVSLEDEYLRDVPVTSDLKKSESQYKELLEQLFLTQENLLKENEKVRKNASSEKENFLRIKNLESSIRELNEELISANRIHRWLSKVVSTNNNHLYKNSREFRKTIDYKIHILLESEVFDEDWYRKSYPDLGDSNLNLAKHFMLSGMYEGRNPSVKYHNQTYINLNYDVLDTDIEPIIHYILYGKNEGRIATKL